MTLPELSKLRRVSITKLQAVFNQLDVLELVNGRYRLTERAIEEEWGKRIAFPDRPSRTLEIISPLGQFMIEENWGWALEMAEQKLEAELLVEQIVTAMEEVRRNRGDALAPRQGDCQEFRVGAGLVR